MKINRVGLLAVRYGTSYFLIYPNLRLTKWFCINNGLIKRGKRSHNTLPHLITLFHSCMHKHVVYPIILSPILTWNARWRYIMIACSYISFCIKYVGIHAQWYKLLYLIFWQGYKVEQTLLMALFCQYCTWINWSC